MKPIILTCAALLVGTLPILEGCPSEKAQTKLAVRKKGMSGWVEYTDLENYTLYREDGTPIAIYRLDTEKMRTDVFDPEGNFLAYIEYDFPEWLMRYYAEDGTLLATQRISE